MKLKKIMTESKEEVKDVFVDAVEQSEISKKNMEDVMKERGFEENKTSDIDEVIKLTKIEVPVKNKFNIVENYLKESKSNFITDGSSFRVKVPTRKDLGTLVEYLKENKVSHSVKKRVKENFRYVVTIYGPTKLKESKLLNEAVSDEAYDIADEMVNAFNFEGKRIYTRDEVEEQFALAIRKLFGIDNIWEVTNEDGVANINGKDFDIDELENDVRGILSYSGWSTIFDGEFDGGVSDIDFDSTEGQILKLIEEETWFKDNYPIVRDYLYELIYGSNVDGTMTDGTMTIEELCDLLNSDVAKSILGESLKESLEDLSDEEIIDILGIEKDEENPYWVNRKRYIKQYRDLKTKCPDCEIYLKGDESYWKDKGTKSSESKDLVAIKILEDESLKEGTNKFNESKELDRQLFVSLVKLGDEPYEGYSILNDGNFVKKIYAKSDEEAIKKFRDYINKSSVEEAKECKDCIKHNPKEEKHFEGVDEECKLKEETSDTFQNLSDEEIKKMYDELKKKGMSEDEIFDTIYQEDCSMDNESLNESKLFTTKEFSVAGGIDFDPKEYNVEIITVKEEDNEGVYKLRGKEEDVLDCIQNEFSFDGPYAYTMSDFIDETLKKEVCSKCGKEKCECREAYDWFDDDEELIYLFPVCGAMGDIKDCKKFHLQYLGKNYFKDEENYVVKGYKKDLMKYSDWLDYEMHPDYLYSADDFSGDIEKDESLEEVEIKDEPLDESLILMSSIGKYKPWAGAIDLWEEIEREGKIDELEFLLEDIYPEGMTMTELNDILWFEEDWVREQLGMQEVEEDDVFTVYIYQDESGDNLVDTQEFDNEKDAINFANRQSAKYPRVEILDKDDEKIY